MKENIIKSAVIHIKSSLWAIGSHRIRREMKCDQGLMKHFGVVEALREINKHHLLSLANTLHNNPDLKSCFWLPGLRSLYRIITSPRIITADPTRLGISNYLLDPEVTVGEKVAKGYCVTAIISQHGCSFTHHMAWNTQHYSIIDGWAFLHKHQSVGLKDPFSCTTALLLLFNLPI